MNIDIKKNNNGTIDMLFVSDNKKSVNDWLIKLEQATIEAGNSVLSVVVKSLDNGKYKGIIKYKKNNI